MEASAVEAFLKRERKRLEGVDDFTLLGVPASADVALIERAGQRMQRRYAALRQDDRLPDDAVQTAAEIAAWLDQAIARIRAGSPRTESVAGRSLSDEDYIFEQGLQAMTAQDWRRAQKCFRAARGLKPDSARNLAWLGWSSFKDPDRDDAGALELLQLADTFHSGFAQGQFFLATVEAETGSPQVAIRRLTRLLVGNPRHDEARRLLAKLQAAQQPIAPRA